MNFVRNTQTPLVSVCLITYKHEAYITQAIESVLNQETDFTCEFIIAEDLSPDKTREIVQSFASQFPIKLILQDKNVGAERNWMDLLRSARGKYVAYLEGDDFWTDSQKLQKQVNILEANHDLVLAYHHCNSLVDGQIINNDIHRSTDFTFGLKDSLYGKNGFSVSMMYKNEGLDLDTLFGIAKGALVGDWPMELFLLKNGAKGIYMSSTMAVYREHVGGVTKYRKIDKEAFINDRLAVCERLLPHMSSKRVVKFFMGELYMHLSLYAKQNNTKLFFKGLAFTLTNMHFTSSSNHNNDYSYRNFISLIVKRLKNKF